MVTVVAFVAATVNVEDAPAAIEAGAAEMVTVGVVVGPVPAPTEPQPASNRSDDKEIAISERIEKRGRETRTFITVLSFLPSPISMFG
jgi:beta-phosphoglucomutase-like phosphatase (HAD superfamily)